MIPLLQLLSRWLERDQPSPAWSDSRLVRACLAGRSSAWAALVDKYKRLVFAVAIEHGAEDDEAADLFQSVWVEAHEHLDELSGRSSIRGWLLETSERRSRVWRKRRLDRVSRVGVRSAGSEATEPLTRPVRMAEIEREQRAREVIDRLPAECRSLIRLLFYSDPPLTFGEAEVELGLAGRRFRRLHTRCLEKLYKALAG